MDKSPPQIDAAHPLHRTRLDAKRRSWQIACHAESAATLWRPCTAKAPVPNSFCVTPFIGSDTDTRLTYARCPGRPTSFFRPGRRSFLCMVVSGMATAVIGAGRPKAGRPSGSTSAIAIDCGTVAILRHCAAWDGVLSKSGNANCGTLKMHSGEPFDS